MNIISFFDKFASKVDGSSLLTYQKELLKDLNEGEDVILMKGRSERVTDTLAYYIAWKMAFANHSTIGVYSPKLRSSRRLGLDLAHKTYFELPEKLQQRGVKKRDSDGMKIENGPEVVIEPARRTLDLMIVDECGYVQKTNASLLHQDCQRVFTYTVTEESRGQGGNINHHEADPTPFNSAHEIILSMNLMKKFEKLYTLNNTSYEVVITPKARNHYVV